MIRTYELLKRTATNHDDESSSSSDVALRDVRVQNCRNEMSCAGTVAGARRCTLKTSHAIGKPIWLQFILLPAQCMISLRFRNRSTSKKLDDAPYNDCDKFSVTTTPCVHNSSVLVNQRLACSDQIIALLAMTVFMMREQVMLPPAVRDHPGRWSHTQTLIQKPTSAHVIDLGKIALVGCGCTMLCNALN